MQCPHPNIYPQTENVLLIKIISDISRWSLDPKYYSFFRCFCWFISFFSFFFFFATLTSMQDLSPARDGTGAPCIGNVES